MKKIVLASAAMGGAALLAFGASGTFAAFSDGAQSGTQSARAGSLYLSPGETLTSNAQALRNLAPGQSASYAFYVGNDGTLPGNLSANFEVVSNDEGTCLGVESRAGDTCTGPNAAKGELADATVVTASYGAVANAAACTLDKAQDLTTQFTAADVSLTDLAAYPTGLAATIPAQGGFCAIVNIALPIGASTPNAPINAVQTDSASFRINYVLAQA